MKLSKEDFESYKEQQESQLKITKMSAWAHETLLRALDKVVGKKKPEKKKRRE